MLANCFVGREMPNIRTGRLWSCSYKYIIHLMDYVFITTPYFIPRTPTMSRVRVAIVRSRAEISQSAGTCYLFLHDCVAPFRVPGKDHVITLRRGDWWREDRPPALSESQQGCLSAIMANPRKFSEKIALHNQKQAEETAAFEAILREVSLTTRVGFVCRQVPTIKHENPVIVMCISLSLECQAMVSVFTENRTTFLVMHKRRIICTGPHRSRGPWALPYQFLWVSTLYFRLWPRNTHNHPRPSPSRIWHSRTSARTGEVHCQMSTRWLAISRASTYR